MHESATRTRWGYCRRVYAGLHNADRDQASPTLLDAAEGDYPLPAVPAVWVVTLHISDRTAQKIVQKHQITPNQVREAVVGVVGLRYVCPVGA